MRLNENLKIKENEYKNQGVGLVESNANII